MDELFRFMNLRPPQSVPQVGISIAAETPLQSELGSIRGHENPWPEMVGVATDFVLSTGIFADGADGYVKDISSLKFHTQFAAFRGALTDPNQHFDLASLRQAILKYFGIDASALIADASFQTDKDRVFDSILAIFITPVAHRGPLAALVEIAQLIDLVQRVAAGDTKLNETGAVQEALTRTILLPPTLFPLRRGLYQPVGIGDLLVVKQHLKKYELGDISHIENVLRGESKKHTTKHSLSTEQTFVTETEKTTETTRDLQTTERFELKSEAEKTIKEDVSVKAGVSVSGKYGETQVSTSTDVAYSNAKSDVTKTATDYSKDITSRASVKVTERVRQQQTTRVIETFEETDDHGFDNTHGQSNVIGVYQWVNKVYEAQIFNYGKRLLFDIMVPEPAAFLLDAVSTQVQEGSLTPPDKFETAGPIRRPITPDELGTRPGETGPGGEAKYYYGDYLAKYGVTGVSAPPLDHITVSKAISASKPEHGEITDKADIEILDGYEADTARVTAAYNFGDGYNDDDDDKQHSRVTVFIADQVYQIVNNDPIKNPPTASGPLYLRSQPGDVLYKPGPVKSLPIAILTDQTHEITVSIDVTCFLTQAAREAWKVATHAAIVQAYLKQQRDYEDKLAVRAFKQGTSRQIGGNPDQNRRLERTEIKKACTALLSGYNLLTFNGIKEDPDPNAQPPAFLGKFPRPDLLPWQPTPADGTAPISFRATADQVQAALQALSSIGAGNIVCTGGPLPGAVTITFGGTLRFQAQPLISYVANNLTGGTNPAPTVVHTTTGAPNVNDVQTLSISGNPTGGTFTLAFRGKVEEQGRIIRFFEQAFEWEQMTYFFYPYYWGRKQTWYDKVLKDNDDPIFAEFLNAGEARVVIPVRPTFEADLGYFLMCGQLWGGADLPSIADSDYLPITEEIKESANAPGDEKPQGDPWEVRLPTTLVKLRADGKLPGWKQPDPKKWEWVAEPPDA